MNQPVRSRDDELPNATGDAMFASSVVRELALMLANARVIDGAELAARLRTQANMLERDSLHAPITPATVDSFTGSMRELASVLDAPKIQPG